MPVITERSSSAPPPPPPVLPHGRVAAETPVITERSSSPPPPPPPPVLPQGLVAADTPVMTERSSSPPPPPPPPRYIPLVLLPACSVASDIPVIPVITLRSSSSGTCPIIIIFELVFVCGFDGRGRPDAYCFCSFARIF